MSGVYVAQVALDGPSNTAGVEEGDVITKIDDMKIDKMRELREYIYGKEPEDKVTLTVVRDGKAKTIEVILGRKS